MTAQGLLQIALYLAVLMLFVKPLGGYMANVYEGRRTFLSPLLGPVERVIYRLAGVHPEAETGWPRYAVAVLLVNLVGFLVVYALQRKFNDAEQAYEEAIRLKPTMAEAYYNLGVFYEFHMRDPVRALVVYKKYLDLGGTDERVQRIVREVKK